MALMTPEQFEASLKELKPRVFMNGKRVENVLKNKNTRTVVEANKASYAWALDPKYQEIMTCFSPLVNEVVNRYTYVSASIEDLVKKAEAGAFTEPRGSRSKKIVDWPDPYLALKVVEKNAQGIVVRGAKINISGAYA